ncbi:M14 family zinc carboxypeptidase [Pseudoalteromonas denitrificans]|uniref:carboxypeptidase T n=1 Tax=Pseudoalteromonas denitrificans DSM 6059 TaxID=1123010 RepID=A0A1I1KJX8_9GAMM|nr:M14 family zinc carboxypeptidase [Pseudoalteromonas denitrificans]SFC60582.1 Fibronectin type III domain-containing protein [Pseudoalteromonas denitrificans DSM 6059]
MKIQYTSYQETISFLKQAMSEHPNLIRLQSIGDTWEKRPIMLATISNDVVYADEKPGLLYTGTIHAREWIGNELAINFIKYIIDNYRFNPKLMSALTRNTFYIVPCLNPDGFEYSRNHFSFWRKNRRDNGDGTFGVDLNRNFDSKFRKGSDSNLSTYGGPHAFSEPETCAIRDFVNLHANITISLDYHSQGNVFFPAHKFNHEVEIEGTDLNILCANMNNEIKKVTGRQYGIHRGKPPANLIRGSGREYYYSKGILATVVEVGTRNIPDHMQDMSQSIDENIPALIYALSEAINYSALAPKRVEGFTIKEIGSDTVTLEWLYPIKDDLYFEIYRSETNKNMCNEQTLVAITKSSYFKDVQLKTGQSYFYNIRAVDKVTKVKSPFSPELRLKTLLANDEFSLTLYPAKQDVGYLAENYIIKNKEHFGYNSMFIGINKNRGKSYGLIRFNLNNLPEQVQITSAQFSLYPMNRVNAKIEKYGQWSIDILDASKITDIYDFNEIEQADSIFTLGQTIESDKMTQGIWSKWQFNGVERSLLHTCGKELLLRIKGPISLPLGNDSQMMQFDIGYGPFGSGLHYRPYLDLIYTQESKCIEMLPAALNVIYPEYIKSNKLACGFNEKGEVVYGQMAFALDVLPKVDTTVITHAYLLLHNKNHLTSAKDIRFTIELVELKDLDYKSVKQRDKIEYIGYEVSNEQLKEKSQHHFIFDSYSRQALERLHNENKPFYFIMRATAESQASNALVDWHCDNALQAKLIINYIERRKYALDAPKDINIEIENKQVKLSWKNPEHSDFVGSFVVRNRFHPPKSPFDGVKIYGGKDEYTFDNFGNAHIPKYYSVFSYDNVPNYSAPAAIYYAKTQTILLDELNDDLPCELQYELEDEDMNLGDD